MHFNHELKGSDGQGNMTLRFCHFTGRSIVTISTGKVMLKRKISLWRFRAQCVRFFQLPKVINTSLQPEDVVLQSWFYTSTRQNIWQTKSRRNKSTACSVDDGRVPRPILPLGFRILPKSWPMETTCLAPSAYNVKRHLQDSLYNATIEAKKQT